MGNGMQIMFLWLSFHLEHLLSKREKEEIAIEEKRIVRWKEREIDVKSVSSRYLWLPLCHITFKYLACPDFILKDSIQNHACPFKCWNATQVLDLNDVCSIINEAWQTLWHFAGRCKWGLYLYLYFRKIGSQVLPCAGDSTSTSCAHTETIERKTKCTK